ncbi:MAG: hypothetical protein WCH20_05090 [Nitrospira sp.]
MSITFQTQTENFQISDAGRQEEQSDGVVQYNIGMLYCEGYGVTQDYATARHWWAEGATQSNAWAPYRIGMRYQNAQHSPEPQ